tara:strand:- start:929 stop:1063 length:135 start_codon:yes stop_codon:yes gene_type:complete
MDCSSTEPVKVAKQKDFATKYQHSSFMDVTLVSYRIKTLWQELA